MNKKNVDYNKMNASITIKNAHIFGYKLIKIQ